MNNEWDEYAEGWDNDPTVITYANNAFSALSKIITLDGLTVLDFGCGTGALSQMLSPKVNNIVALDGSPAMIEALTNKKLANKKLDNVSTICGFLSEALISEQPLLQNRFDLIVASSVCSFLPDYEGTLALLKTLLKNDGLFVQWDWLAEDDNAPMGLSINRVKQAFSDKRLTDSQISLPFVMHSSKGTMPVLMASAKA